MTITTGQYAAGLRALADVYEANPTLELPHGVEHGNGEEVSWLLFGEGEGQRERAAEIVRLIGGKWDKAPGDLFRFKSALSGLRLQVVVDREQVCRRVVKGVRTEVKHVPDPAAPTVEVVETVEDVEWVCEPLLAGVS